MSNSNETPKTAAIYARCSTSQQDTEIQKHDLQEYCAKRGWAYDIFEDKGVSGSQTSRPALDQMMRGVRQRKYDCVVVSRLDRLARSTVQLLSICSELGNLGVQLISLNEAIDTSTPAGKAMFTLVGVFAEFERNIIVERVKGGLEAARRNGVTLGRPRKPFDIQKAIGMRQRGLSLRQTAREMGVSLSTIWRATIGHV